MVLKGIDEIDWFTDRPDRVAGEWSPKKLVKKWESLFGGVEPNAQATFEIGSKRKLVTFEMFKPKLNNTNQILSFKVLGIDQAGKNSLASLSKKWLSDAFLFIDNGAQSGCNWFQNSTGNNFTNVDVSFAYAFTLVKEQVSCLLIAITRCN